MQTIQCVKKVCETVCRQVPVTTTIHCPQTVTKKVCETKMVCVPADGLQAGPGRGLREGPRAVHCPTPVLPSSQQAVAASPQEVVTTTPGRHQVIRVASTGRG